MVVRPPSYPVAGRAGLSAPFRAALFRVAFQLVRSKPGRHKFRQAQAHLRCCAHAGCSCQASSGQLSIAPLSRTVAHRSGFQAAFYQSRGSRAYHAHPA